MFFLYVCDGFFLSFCLPPGDVSVSPSRRCLVSPSGCLHQSDVFLSPSWWRLCVSLKVMSCVSLRCLLSDGFLSPSRWRLCVSLSLKVISLYFPCVSLKFMYLCLPQGDCLLKVMSLCLPLGDVFLSPSRWRLSAPSPSRWCLCVSLKGMPLILYKGVVFVFSSRKCLCVSLKVMSLCLHQGDAFRFSIKVMVSLAV